MRLDFGDQNANTLGRVSWSFHEAQLRAAYREFVAVLDSPVRKCCPGLLAKNDFSSCFVSELAMTADKVCMQVCFDYVLDLEVLRVSLLDVLIDIALRIDDRSFTIRSDQIRSVRQTTETELLEVHELS